MIPGFEQTQWREIGFTAGGGWRWKRRARVIERCPGRKGAEFRSGRSHRRATTTYAVWLLRVRDGVVKAFAAQLERRPAPIPWRPATRRHAYRRAAGADILADVFVRRSHPRRGLSWHTVRRNWIRHSRGLSYFSAPAAVMTKSRTPLICGELGRHRRAGGNAG